MKIKNLYIVSMAGIGDAIWITSVLDIIKSYDKNIAITLITYKSYKQIFENNINLDSRIFVNKKYFLYKNKLIRILYKIFFVLKNYFHFYQCDTILFLDTNTFITKIAKYVYRTKNIIGMDLMSYGYNIKNKDSKYYSKTLKINNIEQIHFMIVYQLLIKQLFKTYNLSIPQIKNKNITTNNKFIDKNKRYNIALCTNGSLPYKQWPIKYFEILINKINNYTNKDVAFYIVGNSEVETNNANTLQNKLTNIDIKNLCGKTSLLETIYILKNMNLVISVDTSITHLAALNNISTISLHGSALPVRSMPINHNSVQLCTYENCSPCDKQYHYDKKICKYPKCMYNLTPEIVFDKVKEILE